MRAAPAASAQRRLGGRRRNTTQTFWPVVRQSRRRAIRPEIALSDRADAQP